MCMSMSLILRIKLSVFFQLTDTGGIEGLVCTACIYLNCVRVEVPFTLCTPQLSQPAVGPESIEGFI